MSSIEVDIEIYCAKCGAGICNNAEATRTKQRNEPSFRIQPCEDCLEDARKEGHDEGYKQGEEEGKKVGYNEGYSEAEKEYTKGENNA